MKRVVIFQFVFTCLFRYIKLTSPLINITMCVGAIVLYSEVIVLGIPTTNVAVKTSLCNVSYYIYYLFTLYVNVLCIILPIYIMYSWFCG